MRPILRYIILIAGLALILSCQKKSRFQPTWDTRVSAPIFKSTLTLSNIVGDSLVKKNPDSSLQLVFNNSIYSFDPNANAIKIPDTSIVTSYKVDALQLANDSIIYPFSLGRLALGLGLAGQIIISENKQKAFIPGIQGVSSADQPVDATKFFKTAKIKKGGISISIRNGFPIPIDTLVFQLKNQTSGTIVSNVTFLNVDTGTTQTQYADLSGKYVEGNMLAKIIDLSSKGSNGNLVLVDTSSKVIVTIKTINIIVDSATADFPSQNIINQDEETTYNLSGGAELKEMIVKSGKLQLKINSSINQKTYFTYKLPSASDNKGDSISFNYTLPPASNGKPSFVTETIDLAGYTIKLTGINGKKYNTFVNHLVVKIDSTGQPIPLASTDSIFIDYGLVGIVPEYIQGYLGQQIIQVGPQTSSLGVFNKIKSGTISFEDVKVNLGIENGLGAEGRITIYQLQSIRSNTNTTVNLSAPSIMNQPLAIARATDNPLTPSNTNFSLNTTNSDIKTWVENIPDKVTYKMDVFMNPHGNTANHGDFAYADTRINVNMDLQMPLSFIAQQLKLVDTIDFSLGSTKAIDHIKDGIFHLICNNGLPLSANLHVALYDITGAYLTDLVTDNSKIAPAPIDNNCKVSANKESVFDISVDAVKMQKIKDAKKAVITAVFDSNNNSTCGSYLKIYSSYNLSCKLTGNFTYFTGE